jgi:hypothetical protein
VYYNGRIPNVFKRIADMEITNPGAFPLCLLLIGSQSISAQMPDLETKVYAKETYSAGDNPYKVKRYAPQYFIDHAKHFEENFSTHPSAPVWSITAANVFSTIHVIDAPEGLILIDTGLNKEQMIPVAEKIKTEPRWR